MIILTGGAGFIGSCFLKRLNEEGYDDIIVVDHLGTDDKWRNLVGKSFSDYIDKNDFLPRLLNNDFSASIDGIMHIGACSSTTESDADYLMRNNVLYTRDIAAWCAKNKCKLWYASSAATYGDGDKGYSDKDDDTPRYRPLNMYGYSKHLVDLWMLKNNLHTSFTGFKFFNVFGPNEYHKGHMRSVIHKAFPHARDEQCIQLFKSYNEKYPDGGQMRDFIYVKDAVDMMMYFFTHPETSGIYNIGTGITRTWNDVANALFSALDADGKIEYIAMPDELQGKYQYYTCADTDKLAATGCPVKCRSLEDALKDYIRQHLLQPDPYL